MEAKKSVLSVVLAITLMFIVAGAPLLPRPAQASYEDAAIFYDELGQHGSWVDYENYGPVWYPSQVEEDWRPYTNGRWTPSEQGYLFETEEPWGWATYHYGNWMPTENYGWVWVPGRTWYPNTVAWRNSPENAPVDTSYIGWAPIPPPNYVPPPAYAPPGYAAPPPGYYGGGYPGGGILELLTAPFWIFAQASRFLLGFGQPYNPGYSYYGCGCLAPVTYTPVIYSTTTIIRTWYYPSYYQPAYFGGRVGLGAYSWGPPVQYVSRVTNINYVTINNYIKNVHVNRVRGGWPDDVVFNRNPHLRKIVPVENPVQLSRIRPMEVRNVDQAVRHLGNPRAIVQPAGLTPLDRTRIPKATTAAFTGERPARVRGMNLPRRAQQQITPQMAERIKSSRPVGAEGPAGPGARGRGPMAGPEGFQKGIVGAPQDQRGRRVGPGEGPGLRRGPVEGFQGPAERGVRRGPVEAPEGAKGVRRGPVVQEGFQPQPGGVRRGPAEGPGLRRGPVEGFQGPVPGGVRRGPVEPPQGALGVRRGPAESFQGPGQAGRGRPEGFQAPGAGRRGTGEGLQPQEQQRRQQMQQQQLMRQQIQSEQGRRQQMQQQMRQQQDQQRRQQMQQQQLFRRQQEQQRQKIKQQQEQSRHQEMRPPQQARRVQQDRQQKKEPPQQHSQNQRGRQAYFPDR